MSVPPSLQGRVVTHTRKKPVHLADKAKDLSAAIFRLTRFCQRVYGQKADMVHANMLHSTLLSKGSA